MFHWTKAFSKAIIKVKNSKGVMYMKGLLKEFKTFAMKGNVIDLAIGVIIGAAFGKIVTSLVNDIIMPIIGLVIGRVNFADLKYPIKAGVAATTTTTAIPELAIRYGSFIQTIFDFLIIALAIFIAVKAVNKLHKRLEKQKAQAPVAPPAPVKTELLLEEIRDLLKSNKK